jgi:hypothetical protein
MLPTKLVRGSELGKVLVLVFFFISIGATCGLAATPPLPQTKLIPDSGKLPFGSARYPGANAIDLDHYGYVEEEYYLSGKAAVRDENGAILIPDAPYTTRILIRKPKDTKKFSGNVIVTPFNWAGESVREWGYTKYYLLNHGDVFVGVTNTRFEIVGFISKNGIKLLQTYDPIRYAPLNFYDDKDVKHKYMAQEQDMLAQLALVLKTNLPGGPLQGLKVERLFAVVEGIQAAELQNYVAQGRHKEWRMPDGKPLFDAYLMGAYHLLPPPDAAQRDDVVYAIIQHQREMHRDAKDKVAMPVDTDTPKFRLYDFVGSPHMGAIPLGMNGEHTNDDSPELASMAAAEAASGAAPPKAPRLPPPAVCNSRNEEPVAQVFAAILDAMKQWVKSDIPMPRAPRVEVAEDGEKIDPATGNALGGLRPPWIEVPAATYLTGDVVGCGPTEPMTLFDAAKLKSLYGSYDNYAQKFERAKSTFIQAGFLLKENAGEVKPTASVDSFK